MWRCGTRRPGLPPRRSPGLSTTFRISIFFYFLPGWLRIYKVPAGSGAATRAPCHPLCTHTPEGSGREEVPARDTCELGAVPCGPLAKMSHSPCPCHPVVPGIQALRQISKAGSALPPTWGPPALHFYRRQWEGPGPAAWAALAGPQQPSCPARLLRLCSDTVLTDLGHRSARPVRTKGSRTAPSPPWGHKE